MEHPRTKVDILDNNGNTALHYAVKHADCLTAVKLLIDRNADLNVTNRKGMTPLHIALDQGNEEVIKMLIHAGADLALEGPDCTTLLEDLTERFPQIKIPERMQENLKQKRDMTHGELFRLLRDRR